MVCCCASGWYRQFLQEVEDVVRVSGFSPKTIIHHKYVLTCFASTPYWNDGKHFTIIHHHLPPHIRTYAIKMAHPRTENDAFAHIKMMVIDDLWRWIIVNDGEASTIIPLNIYTPISYVKKMTVNAKKTKVKDISAYYRLSTSIFRMLRVDRLAHQPHLLRHSQ